LRSSPGSEDWPDPLDGVIADPNHHLVLFENDRVRVVQTKVRAGETTPLHTHVLPTLLYVLSGSHVVRRNDGGDVLVDTRTDDPRFVMPPVQWSEGIDRHTLENPGPDDLVVIGVELKMLTTLGAPAMNTR
jgi:hypothetical protein